MNCREERLEDLDPAQLDLSYMEKERVLKLYKGNISQTAAALGIQRNTLYSKINKYEIQLGNRSSTPGDLGRRSFQKGTRTWLIRIKNYLMNWKMKNR